MKTTETFAERNIMSYRETIIANITKADIEKTYYVEPNGDMWHISVGFGGHVSIRSDSNNTYN